MHTLKSLSLILLLLAMYLVAPAVQADRCFGAVGMECGSFAGGPLGGVAHCVALGFNPATTYCDVSGGSWTHDTCCAANSNGRWCAGPGSADNSGCVSSWNRAVHRYIWGFNWGRVVNGTFNDTDGTVNRSQYCARPGSGVHKNDTEYCCSNRYRQPTWYEWLGRPNLRVCRS